MGSTRSPPIAQRRTPRPLAPGDSAPRPKSRGTADRVGAASCRHCTFWQSNFVAAGLYGLCCTIPPTPHAGCNPLAVVPWPCGRPPRHRGWRSRVGGFLRVAEGAGPLCLCKRGRGPEVGGMPWVWAGSAGRWGRQVGVVVPGNKKMNGRQRPQPHGLWPGAAHYPAGKGGTAMPAPHNRGYPRARKTS